MDKCFGSVRFVFYWLLRAPPIIPPKVHAIICTAFTTNTRKLIPAPMSPLIANPDNPPIKPPNAVMINPRSTAFIMPVMNPAINPRPAPLAIKPAIVPTMKDPIIGIQPIKIETIMATKTPCPILPLDLLFNRYSFLLLLINSCSKEKLGFN